MNAAVVNVYGDDAASAVTDSVEEVSKEEGRAARIVSHLNNDIGEQFREELAVDPVALYSKPQAHAMWEVRKSMG